MNIKITAGVVLMMALATTIGVIPILLQQSVYAPTNSRAAPPTVTGDNVYVAWWSNKTGNDEVLFRASTDKGQTFEDKINLSNTPDAGSERVGINSDGDSVVVTWWETNETSEFPVMRVSDDNGKTFGPLLKLAANGTLGE
jgi:hypothetical protein